MFLSSYVGRKHCPTYALRLLSHLQQIENFLYPKVKQSAITDFVKKDAGDNSLRDFCYPILAIWPQFTEFSHFMWKFMVKIWPQFQIRNLQITESFLE